MPCRQSLNVNVECYPILRVSNLMTVAIVSAILIIPVPYEPSCLQQSSMPCRPCPLFQSSPLLPCYTCTARKHALVELEECRKHPPPAGRLVQAATACKQNAASSCCLAMQHLPIPTLRPCLPFQAAAELGQQAAPWWTFREIKRGT